jgi:hypothetical protein
MALDDPWRADPVWLPVPASTPRRWFEGTPGAAIVSILPPLRRSYPSVGYRTDLVS